MKKLRHWELNTLFYYLLSKEKDMYTLMALYGFILQDFEAFVKHHTGFKLNALMKRIEVEVDVLKDFRLLKDIKTGLDIGTLKTLGTINAVKLEGREKSKLVKLIKDNNPGSCLETRKINIFRGSVGEDKMTIYAVMPTPSKNTKYTGIVFVRALS